MYTVTALWVYIYIFMVYVVWGSGLDIGFPRPSPDQSFLRSYLFAPLFSTAALWRPLTTLSLFVSLSPPTSRWHITLGIGERPAPGNIELFPVFNQ